jgi:hypothetical protein
MLIFCVGPHASFDRISGGVRILRSLTAGRDPGATAALGVLFLAGPGERHAHATMPRENKQALSPFPGNPAFARRHYTRRLRTARLCRVMGSANDKKSGNLLRWRGRLCRQNF